jgi:hypothetical protein
MSVHILNRAQSFGPGSDVWFVASRKSTPTGTEKVDSPIINRVDWYLNFQLTRAHLRAPQSLASELKSILNENQLPDFSSPDAMQSPLMIIAQEQFPTKVVLDVLLTTQKSDWAQSLCTVWEKLNKPSVRVFLPPEMTPDEFQSLWPKQHEAEITLVPS